MDSNYTGILCHLAQFLRKKDPDRKTVSINKTILREFASRIVKDKKVIRNFVDTIFLINKFKLIDIAVDLQMIFDNSGTVFSSKFEELNTNFVLLMCRTVQANRIVKDKFKKICFSCNGSVEFCYSELFRGTARSKAFTNFLQTSNFMVKERDDVDQSQSADQELLTEDYQVG